MDCFARRRAGLVRSATAALLAGFAFLPLPLAPLSAQPTAPAAPAPSTAAPEEPAAELSPFVVESERDTGYRQTMAGTATRIGTAIIDTPLNIQVISREFIDDLAIDNLNKAFDYAAGIKTSHDFSVRNTGSVRIRGFQTSNVYRDGFTKYASFHLDGVDRIEVVKGPSALFFGVSQPGGVINYSSKRPEFIDATSIDLTYGSDDYKRGMLDHQAVFADKRVAYRLVASKRDSDDWIDYNHWDETYVQAGLSFRPTSALQFNVGYERSDQQKDGGPVPAIVANVGYMDDWEAGRLQTAANGLPETVGEWRLRKFNETGIYPEQWTGFWFPRGFEWNRTGPGAFENAFNELFEAQAYLRLGRNLNLRAAFVHQDAEYETSWFINQDPHQSPHPMGAPTPTHINYGFLIAPAWRGTGYNVPGAQADLNKVNQFQSDLSYAFEAFGAKHTVLGSFEWADNEFRQYGFILDEAAFTAAGGTLGSFSDPGIPGWSFFPGAFGTLFRDVTDPNFTPPNLRDFLSSRSPNHNPSNSTDGYTRAYAVSYQGTWFDNRLRVMGGARKTYQGSIRYGANGRTGNWNETSGTTPTIGANFYLTPNTVLYASYNESFVPQTGVNPTFRNEFTGETIGGTTIDNEEGAGMEVGLKLQAMESRLTATLSVFEVERDRILIADSLTNQRLQDENQAGTARWVDAVTGSIVSFNLRTNSGLQRTRGFEFDVMWTPIKNFQALLGYTYLWEREIVRDDPSNINVRNGGLFNPTPNDGRNRNWSELAEVPEHLFYIWGKYQFTEGRLRGFGFGFGGNYESESPGSQDRFDRAWIAGDFWKFDGLIEYTPARWENRLSFQLNVNNVFDKEYITGSFGAAPTRTWRLSARYAY